MKDKDQKEIVFNGYNIKYVHTMGSRYDNDCIVLTLDNNVMVKLNVANHILPLIYDMKLHAKRARKWYHVLKIDKGKAEYNRKLKLYLYLYDQASAVIEKYNLCHDCDKKSTWCCGGCEYLTNTGCKYKVLPCRLWLCNEARKRYPEATKELDKIYKLADTFYYLSYRNLPHWLDKKDVLRDEYKKGGVYYDNVPQDK